MKTWTTIDKTTWGPGPWQDEPDKVHWIDAATDMDCLLHRGPLGNWCGYVAVSEDHPWFGIGYDDLESHIEVHGGLTFASSCSESDDPSTGICHIPEPGRPEHVWWFGFDCAHGWDRVPGMEAREREYGWSSLDADNVYRDRAYVEDEVRSLARQLKAVSS